MSGPLASEGRGTSQLAAEHGRPGGPQWVLRWLPPAEPGGLRSALRPDILDLACLKHPSLALPSSFGREPASGRTFLLRPFVPGSDMISALRGRGPKSILPWLTAAAEALAILHRFRLLHRGVKASNFIVPRAASSSRAFKEPRVVLCDPAPWPEGHERADDLDGAAPELRGKSGASFASDLYALGAVYYRLLSGSIVEVGAGGFPAPPSELNAEVPIDLDRIVMKLLSPEPDRRYRDAGDLVEDLKRLGGSRSPLPRAPPDCFLDRRDELSPAGRLLGATERSCVLAVAGAAGMGKTAFLQRLSLEAQLAGFETVMVLALARSAGAPEGSRGARRAAPREVARGEGLLGGGPPEPAPPRALRPARAGVPPPARGRPGRGREGDGNSARHHPPRPLREAPAAGDPPEGLEFEDHPVTRTDIGPSGRHYPRLCCRLCSVESKSCVDLNRSRRPSPATSFTFSRTAAILSEPSGEKARA